MPQFEWDEDKNRINLRKHGICFEEAQTIFNGPVFTALDIREDYDEQRFISLGLLHGVVVVVVVHTERDDRIRLISARKANKRESQTYHEHLEETDGGDQGH